MKHILALHILASFGLLTGTIAAHGQPVRVYSDAGSIFIERGGGTTKLTASEMDIDPVLSPNGGFVVYTRQGRGRSRRHYEPHQFCPTEPRPDELRRINADGSNDRLLLKEGAATVPSISSAILKASNSAPTADGSISSRRLGQHQTHCTRSTCALAKKIFCCLPMMSWFSTSA